MKQSTQNLFKRFETKVNELALLSNLLYNSLADETGNITNDDADELFNKLKESHLNTVYEALCDIDI